MINDKMTLRDACDMVEKSDPKKIHFLVRFFENPSSRFALRGAVDLDNHDCIHMMLGKGFKLNDEAFVIGFTMGSAGANKLHVAIYKFVSRFLYPKIYSFKKPHLKIFDEAYKMGKESKAQEIHKFPFEDHMDKPLGKLRKMLGLELNFQAN